MKRALDGICGSEQALWLYGASVSNNDCHISEQWTGFNEAIWGEGTLF